MADCTICSCGCPSGTAFPSQLCWVFTSGFFVGSSIITKITDSMGFRQWTAGDFQPGPGIHGYSLICGCSGIDAWTAFIFANGSALPGRVQVNLCSPLSATVTESSVLPYTANIFADLSQCGMMMAPPSKEPLPGVMTQAANFAAALAAHVAAGLPEASPELFDRRMALCLACEHRTSDDPATARCVKCGCGAAVKARWAEQTCPVGKW